MKELKFGTDGVRAIANSELTPEYALQVGISAGRWLSEHAELPQCIVIGKDTRRSGDMLGAAVAAGIASAGVDVVDMGVVPTPGVSHAVRSHGRFGLGIVISASHNPAPDNGIKILGPDGGKLAEDQEATIISYLAEAFEVRPSGAGVGVLSQDLSLVDRYCDFLVGLVPERLDGMTLILDAANGAAFAIGAKVLERLGATVTKHGDKPNGMNINEECGATMPAFIRGECDLANPTAGIALDGDADRAVFSDGHGRLVNGDRTIAIWAAHWKAETVVGTIMSNTGFETYMIENGITVFRANVGDKYVAEMMKAHGSKIGGEQSGHIIFPHNGPTGDGMATALELLRVLKREGKTLAEVYDRFENWPQILVNVTVADRTTWREPAAVQQALRDAETALEATGRINVRESGTQPLVRVMVESSNQEVCESVSEMVVGTLIRESGGSVYSRVDLAHDLGD